MNRRRLAVIVAALAIIACAQQSYSQPKPKTLFYEVKLKSPLGNMGTRKMYVKGSNFAWFYDSAGVKASTIKNKDGVFLIPPSKRQIGKYPPDSNRRFVTTYLPGPAGDVKSFLNDNGAKRSGSETVSGKKCDAYTYTEKLTKWKCKLWVDNKTMTPVKMQMNGAKKTDRTDVTYVSYKLGTTVPDSVFELPKGLPIRPMPDPRKYGAVQSPKP